jgi:hypothetical protein
VTGLGPHREKLTLRSHLGVLNKADELYIVVAQKPKRADN